MISKKYVYKFEKKNASINFIYLFPIFFQIVFSFGAESDKRIKRRLTSRYSWYEINGRRNEEVSAHFSSIVL